MAIRLGYKTSALSKHCKERHNGNPQMFTFRTMSTHRTILNGFKSEVVYIEKQPEGSSMNSKEEGGRVGVVRLNVFINRC